MYQYQRIKDLREDADLYQEDVAKILDTSQQQYSRWERGAQEIPLHHAITLAKFYKVSMDYLTGLTNDKRYPAMTEKYLRIDPSGKITWINIDRVPYEWIDGDGLSLDQIYAAIGCSCMEQVRTVLPGIVLLVDESGRVKTPPQRHNEVASRLYTGWLCGMDNIVGPAIVCALRPTGPLLELDLFPLNQTELAKLSLYLGVQLPET